jgi:hypothetical protein
MERLYDFPDGCEQTLCGLPAPTRLPAAKMPVLRARGDRPREYLLDVAATMVRGGWSIPDDLTDDLTDDICRDYTMLDGELRDEREVIELMASDVAIAQTQRDIARKVALAALAELTRIKALLLSEQRETLRLRELAAQLSTDAAEATRMRIAFESATLSIAGRTYLDVQAMLESQLRTAKPRSQSMVLDAFIDTTVSDPLDHFEDVT